MNNIDNKIRNFRKLLNEQLCPEANLVMEKDQPTGMSAKYSFSNVASIAPLEAATSWYDPVIFIGHLPPYIRWGIFQETRNMYTIQEV